MDNVLGNKLYVGNLDYDVVEEDLIAYFSNIGNVGRVLIIEDRETNRSKGFGFVTMETHADAKKIIDELDGTEFKGRELVIRIARPK